MENKLELFSICASYIMAGFALYESLATYNLLWSLIWLGAAILAFLNGNQQVSSLRIIRLADRVTALEISNRIKKK